jgi:hypothetical protein
MGGTAVGLAAWAVLGIASVAFGDAAASPATMPATAPATAPTTAPARAQVQAVPDAAAQEIARKLIRLTLKDDYAGKGVFQRRQLARKLLQQASQTDDAALRYVLLAESRDVAALAALIPSAMQAVDELVKSYGVDGAEMRYATLLVVGRSTESVAGQEALARKCLVLAATAMKRDLAQAPRFLALASAAAGKTQKVKLVALVQERQKESHEIDEGAARWKAAMELLKRKPDDAEAKLAAGRFLCLVRGDFDAGVALLAGANDAALKGLAERELTNSPDAGEQVALANAWWELAGTLSGLAKANVQQHAAAIYARALPKLAGLNKSVAAERLGAIEEERLKSLQFEPGLSAEIYDGEGFERFLKARVDSQINFDWMKGAPGEGLPKDHFSIRWTGWIRAPRSGKYILHLTANAGAKMWIDENKLIDGPTLGRQRDGIHVFASLSEGLHSIRLDYWEDTGEANVKLRWLAPEAAGEEVVPAAAFYHEWTEMEE